MRKGTGLGAGFLLAAVCGVGLGLLIPSLLPFAVLGIALALLPALLRLMGRARAHRLPHISRRVEVGLVAGAACLGVVVAIIGLRSSGGASPSPSGAFRAKHKSAARDLFHTSTVALPTTYTGEAVQHTSPDRLDLTERLWVHSSSLDLPPEELRTLALGLRAKHWRPSEEKEHGFVFKRRREVALRSRLFPPETGNTIALPRLVLRDPRDGLTMRLPLSEGSRLLLIAAPETFGPSYPPGVQEARPVTGLEQVAIPVAENELVEVDLRSPLFRNALIGRFADVTIPGAINWLIGILGVAFLALFNEEIRKRLKRLLKRLRPGFRSAPG